MSEIAFLWGVKQSFLRYLAHQPGTRASVGGGAASTKDGRFLFPAVGEIDVDSITMPGTAKFEGDVRFTAHGGMLDLVLSDPWIEMDDATARLSFATNRSGGPGLVRTVVAELVEKPEESGGGRRVWKTTLAPSGVPVFGDAYAAGELLDPAFFLPSPLSSLKTEHLS